MRPIHESEEALTVSRLAAAAAPFIAAGMPKQEAFVRAMGVFESALWFVRGLRKDMNAMSGWKEYRKTAVQEMRPYNPGEDLTLIGVAVTEIPVRGGMICRNAQDPRDQWYIGPEFFAANYEAVEG